MDESLQSQNPLIQKSQEIFDRLLERFGLTEWRIPLDAMDELISTVLSQNTNDRNRDIAFFALKNKFPSWDQVRDSDLQTVIDLIRPAGLANQKGARIQALLREITAERGNLDLSFLKFYSAEEAHAWLTNFKGVGLKTAAIVMQFALGIPAFPVDTHVYRVSGRLGLRPEKMNVDQAHLHLAKLFNPDSYSTAHLNLIRLGREICHARKPDCNHCPLTDLCEYYSAISK